MLPDLDLVISRAQCPTTSKIARKLVVAYLLSISCNLGLILQEGPEYNWSQMSKMMAARKSTKVLH